ncbi:MAG: apocarotenoid-15,15'-oxygenase [Pseudomonadales bacterium]|nr:apocarotenoid-15,15'-oxygenase [Pseudomonadales bacterium]
MQTTLKNDIHGNLPENDDHPYRTGAWTPNTREYEVIEPEVIGDLPSDLAGVYIRNTENPLHGALGRYHPFDGDGMLHSLYFDSGHVEYRNRFIRTDGFEAELDAGEPLWAGLRENPSLSKQDGWGARTRLKDSSSTDVVVHNGIAATSFYQCGDVYELDPRTLEHRGKADWTKDVTPGWGVSAHTKVDEATGEMLFFNYSKEAPYMHYGVVDNKGQLAHYIPIELPGPRLPHDMAFTDRYAILNDLPLFWDPEALTQGAHAVRFFPELGSRFGIVPRRGSSDQVVWFTAKPTYVLHWINAFEDGDEIVLDGYTQDPRRGIRTKGLPETLTPFAMLDINAIGAHAYRWRFNMKTGEVQEGPLEEGISEFGMINPNVAGKRYQYTWGMTAKPGWFLFDGMMRLDVHSGDIERYQFPEGVYASESPMAPRVGSQAEDDGYVMTFTTDMNTDSSACEIFAADSISKGPIAKIKLPQRICVGTHSYWAGKNAL